MNKNAQKLGRLAKGVPKKYSKEDIEKIKERLAQARKSRWVKEPNEL